MLISWPTFSRDYPRVRYEQYAAMCVHMVEHGTWVGSIHEEKGDFEYDRLKINFENGNTMFVVTRKEEVIDENKKESK